MRLYISTPINGRREATFEQKYAAAKARVEQIKREFDDWLSRYDAIVTTFDINPPGTSEAEAMGRCIQAVIESDEILLDKGWQYSGGCLLEVHAARCYGVADLYIDKFELELSKDIKQ